MSKPKFFAIYTDGSVNAFEARNEDDLQKEINERSRLDDNFDAILTRKVLKTLVKSVTKALS